MLQNDFRDEFLVNVSITDDIGQQRARKKNPQPESAPRLRAKST
jgi:hypothetical protein